MRIYVISLYTRKVTESVVFSRTWICLILLLEMLVYNWACVLAENCLTNFYEGWVEIFIQIILWRVDIWSWCCNFLSWRNKAIRGFWKTELCLCLKVRIDQFFSSNFHIIVLTRSWQFFTSTKSLLLSRKSGCHWIS